MKCKMHEKKTKNHARKRKPKACKRKYVQEMRGGMKKLIRRLIRLKEVMVEGPIQLKTICSFNRVIVIVILPSNAVWSNQEFIRGRKYVTKIWINNHHHIPFVMVLLNRSLIYDFFDLLTSLVR